MTSMILTEKPDVAKKISATFGGKPKEGYFEIEPCSTFPDGAYIGFAIGHLVEFFMPEDYDENLKTWNLKDLPIIPNTFQYKVSSGKEKPLNILKKIMNDSKVNEIIIATDAGREGENIAYSIINLVLKKKKPIRRLWVSSMTPDAFRKGFKTLKEGSETISYYYEANARAIADWLIGMNMTRSVSIHLQKAGIKQQGVFSVGRVQTPVLKIIVDREREIDNFVSEPFWTIQATFDMSGKKYLGKWFKEENGKKIERFMDKEKASDMLKACENKKATIQNVEKEQKKIKPPKLFSLSNLQTKAGKRYKYSPAKTLEIAQSLYTKGYISYPRTDSDAITKEEAKQLPTIFDKLKEIKDYAPFLPTPIKSEDLGTRYINPKRVSDHYAIIPTEQVPDMSNLSKEDANIYDLVVRSVIAAHFPDAIFDHTSIITLVDQQETFITQGKVLQKEGWRKIFFPNGKLDDEEKEEEDAILPDVSPNETGKTEKIELKEGKTQPPNRFTESNLINVMKYAGRWTDTEQLDEEELEEEMGKLSIGTEATRAGIIETLMKRKFLSVKKSKVYPTEKAKILIDALGEDTILCSPILTAKWESVLEQIGKGKVNPHSFIEKGKKLTISSLKKIEEKSKKWDFVDRVENNKQTVGKCPLCNHNIVDKGKFYGCEGYQTNGCNFGMNHTILKKKISETQIKKLLSNGKTDEIKGFISKKGKKFNAYLYWNKEEKKIALGFKQKNINKIGVECPFCKRDLVERVEFIGCSGYKDGCKFTIPKTYFEKKVTNDQVNALLKEGKTNLIQGFKGKYGSFDGWLYIDKEKQKVRIKIKK